uniref:Uncharacterized protein n=1 Tax=Octopus bimaculoides TaxID=37653 RepID=A0A0L8GD23_OCTBM
MQETFSGVWYSREVSFNLMLYPCHITYIHPRGIYECHTLSQIFSSSHPSSVFLNLGILLLQKRK